MIDVARIPLHKMPDVDTEILKFRKAKWFASLDLSDFYWSLPLTGSAREALTIRGPGNKFYTPNRIIQGSKNSALYAQKVADEAFGQLSNIAVTWIDDTIIGCETADELIEAIETYLKICSEKGFFVHSKKSNLFGKEQKWNGRIISENGIKLAPRKLQGLKDMPLPATAADLQQFLCSVNWIRASIPDFNRKVQLLSNRLNKATSQVGTKKSRLVRIRLDLSNEEIEEYNQMKHEIECAVMLAHRDENKALHLMCDASDLSWGAVLTQTPIEDVGKSL